MYPYKIKLQSGLSVLGPSYNSHTHTPLTAVTDQIDYFNLILINQFPITNEQNQNQMNVMAIFVRKTHEYCVN